MVWVFEVVGSGAVEVDGWVLATGRHECLLEAGFVVLTRWGEAYKLSGIDH